ncbi:putative manganese efflux pump MntP [Clostridium butyricum]|uniref:Putative manganese efflux pump MntP n=1 Tax=Clostridium butyricum TaxID=1492 RepID=A0A512TIY5_CLOBU|nr:manganese efflux pump [Clostridium butyricum]NOW23210.1 putative Mn2+ efflux pump MntP [Clostridium butyricum]GEQ20061.1 putative manganese efflux pump MntP [Clostridium butyricum]
MSIYYVFIIGIALAMDAFGVSLGVGLNPILKKRNKIKFIVSFAFFQFLFTFLGGIAGHLFDVYITSIPSIAGGIVMSVVGIVMIIDGLKEKESDLLIKDSTCIILGISVSIDAFVIGFTTFCKLSSIIILLVNSILIGLITLFLCTLTFFFCRYIKKISFISKYANFLGGIALIIFGIKVIFF